MAEGCSLRWPLHLFFAVRCLGRYTLTTLTNFEGVILTNSGYSHDESMQQKDWRIYTCANTSCLKLTGEGWEGKKASPCGKSLPANCLIKIFFGKNSQTNAKCQTKIFVTMW